MSWRLTESTRPASTRGSILLGIFTGARPGSNASRGHARTAPSRHADDAQQPERAGADAGLRSCHEAPPSGRLLWNFLNGLLPCGLPPGLECPPAAGAFRRMSCRGGSCRLAEASLISSSLISSHWASVRCLSGIARSSCRRWRGGIGCGVSMAALSRATGFSCAPVGGSGKGTFSSYICALSCAFRCAFDFLPGLAGGIYPAIRHSKPSLFLPLSKRID